MEYDYVDVPVRFRSPSRGSTSLQVCQVSVEIKVPPTHRSTNVSTTVLVATGSMVISRRCIMHNTSTPPTSDSRMSRFMYVTIDVVWIGELGLFTTYTHHSKLPVITALSLISTLYKSLAHTKSSHSLAVSWQRILTVEIFQLPALRLSCHSSPCRNLVKCQLNYSAISSQPPLQSSAELSWPGSSLYSLGADPTEKTACSSPCIVVMGGCLATAPDIVAEGTCLPSRCSETPFCLFACCVATAVLVVCFEVFA
jgi:hypothetical protein